MCWNVPLTTCHAKKKIAAPTSKRSNLDSDIFHKSYVHVCLRQCEVDGEPPPTCAVVSSLARSHHLCARSSTSRLQVSSISRDLLCAYIVLALVPKNFLQKKSRKRQNLIKFGAQTFSGLPRSCVLHIPSQLGPAPLLHWNTRASPPRCSDVDNSQWSPSPAAVVLFHPPSGTPLTRRPPLSPCNPRTLRKSHGKLARVHTSPRSRRYGKSERENAKESQGTPLGRHCFRGGIEG